MATQKPRYSITLDEETFNAVEDFRFKNRYNSRSQATLELIKLGLQVLKNQEESKNKNS